MSAVQGAAALLGQGTDNRKIVTNAVHKNGGRIADLAWEDMPIAVRSTFCN